MSSRQPRQCVKYMYCGPSPQSANVVLGKKYLYSCLLNVPSVGLWGPYRYHNYVYKELLCSSLDILWSF